MESVAVDFMLEDGYMKATKVVSLSPLPASVQCYPPPPPSSSVCRTVAEDASTATATVPAAQGDLFDQASGSRSRTGLVSWQGHAPLQKLKKLSLAPRKPLPNAKKPQKRLL